MTMRKLPLGVAVSTALHAAAVVWVSARPAALAVAPSQPAASTPIEVIAVAPAPAPALERRSRENQDDQRERAALERRSRENQDDQRERAALEPIEAILLDAPAAPPDRAASLATDPPAARTAPRAPASTRPQSPPATGAIIVPGASSATETAPPGRSPYLTMRGKEPPRLGLPGGRWDPLDHAPAGTAPEKRRTTGIFHESGGGTHESDQDGFTAKINRDGTVKLDDKPSASIHIALPRLKDIGRVIAAWYEAPKGAFGETVEAPMSKQINVSIGPSTDPGDEAHPEHLLKDHAVTAIIPIFGGRLELTDWMMRREGIDPYASRKLKFLDATRDERVQIGNRHRAQQLAMTPQIVRRNLERLWAALPDTAARKRALFDLWDECVETGDPSVVAASDAARRLVIAFIRSHLPADGPDAFTPAELDALARARRSSAAFQPYEP